MSDKSLTERMSLQRLTLLRPLAERLATDVCDGLTGAHKWLPPIYFYDERGSQLFEQITQLDEYYLTRTEREILERHAGELLEVTSPDEIVELGSGSSIKTDLLLTQLYRTGGRRYGALDISETALVEAATRLTQKHLWLSVDSYVGDFHTDLNAIPRSGRRLLVFLGSTLGNLDTSAREKLLRTIAGTLTEDDAFLLGVDLVKASQELIPAYDDAQGITARFNRNVLEVINRELDGNLPVEAFEHQAIWNSVEERIEMHLVASTNIRAHLTAIDLHLTFEAGEHIVTEHSHKFRIDQLRRELAGVGLHVSQVLTDDADRFAVILVRLTRHR
ncbi:MAG: L-histidine N(alpha)-methyltransferase [Nitriliruptoraceae bacterium]